MEKFNLSLLKQIYIPQSASHKGQNGKVLIIAGSKLFHSAALWPAEIASKIVDMVYFSSLDENNEIAKEKFQNGIMVPRGRIEEYIEEADSVLIGPGLPREEGLEEGDDNTKILTQNLLSQFPYKKWVVDGGSLQVINPEILPKTSIITPNKKEFEMLFGVSATSENAKEMAKKYKITVLLKGEVDYVCSPDESVEIPGGNAGMTKGGTGDVLAGLVAAFYAKNDAFTSAACASFINKKAGESLAERAGLYFNASDLIDEIPGVLKKYIGF